MVIMNGSVVYRAKKCELTWVKNIDLILKDNSYDKVPLRLKVKSNKLDIKLTWFLSS